MNEWPSSFGKYSPANRYFLSEHTNQKQRNFEPTQKWHAAAIESLGSVGCWKAPSWSRSRQSWFRSRFWLLCLGYLLRGEIALPFVKWNAQQKFVFYRTWRSQVHCLHPAVFLVCWCKWVQRWSSLFVCYIQLRNYVRVWTPEGKSFLNPSFVRSGRVPVISKRPFSKPGIEFS